MSIKRSTKFGKYKLTVSFDVNRAVKKRVNGYPLYCGLSFMRRYTKFPVLGGYRFVHCVQVPIQVIEDSFELITAVFGECYDPTKDGGYNIKKFIEKYRSKKYEGEHLDDIYISLMVAHLHKCFEKNFITERQLTLCKNEILNGFKNIQK